MDNAIVKKAILKEKVTKEMTLKLLTVMLLSGISSAALLGCSQPSEDEVTVSSVQDQDSLTTNDYQESRNTGAWGGVYMSREELTAPLINIVDDSSLPNMDIFWC